MTFTINSFRQFLLCLRRKKIDYLEPIFYKHMTCFMFGLNNIHLRIVINREIRNSRYDFEQKFEMVQQQIKTITFKFKTNPSKYDTEAYQLLVFKRYFTVYEWIMFREKLSSIFPLKIRFKKNVWL